MSKVIAIMDKPKDCQECVFGVCKYSLPLSINRKSYYCQLKDSKGRVAEDFDYDAEVHLSNCPLKEVPEKKNRNNRVVGDYLRGRSDGYNACIDDILKGCEGNDK